MNAPRRISWLLLALVFVPLLAGASRAGAGTAAPAHARAAAGAGTSAPAKKSTPAGIPGHAKPAAAAHAATPALETESPQPGLPVPPLRLPSPVERKLASGLRVVVLQDPRLPIVHVQLLVPAGSASEPEDQPGVAPLTASLLRQGTASRSAQQFNEDLAQAGAIFATSCERDYALVACGGRSSAIEGVLELMSDAVLNPIFGASEFENLRDSEARDLEARRGTLAAAADMAIGEAAFAPHPYAHASGGDPRSLSAVEFSAVQAFHRDRWRPDHAVLTIAGDVTPERAFAAAEDWFGRWAGTSAKERVRPAPRPIAGVRLLDVDGANYAEVRVAVPGPGTASPDHDAWSLVVTWIEDSALPANATASEQEGRDASLLVLSASASLQQAPDVAHQLINALRVFHIVPPRPGALDTLRRRIAQRYPLTIGTLGSLTTQWQLLDLAHPGSAALADYGERLAKAEFAPGTRPLAAAPIVLVAGPAASLRAPLEAQHIGPVSVLSLLTPASATAQLPSATTEQLARGRTLVAAALAAHGGADLIRGVHSLVTEGSVTLQANGRDLTGQYSASRVDPDRYSFSTRVLRLDSRQILAGDRGWTIVKLDSAVVARLDSAGLQRLRVAASSDLVHQLRFAADTASGSAWRGTETIAGRDCDLVDYDTPFGRQRLALDAKSHQVVEMASGIGPRGTWLDRRVLSDYHPVDGVLLPWAEDRTLAGERMWRMTAKVVGINREVPKALFERPAKEE